MTMSWGWGLVRAEVSSRAREGRRRQPAGGGAPCSSCAWPSPRRCSPTRSPACACGRTRRPACCAAASAGCPGRPRSRTATTSPRRSRGRRAPRSPRRPPRTSPGPPGRRCCTRTSPPTPSRCTGGAAERGGGTVSTRERQRQGAQGRDWIFSSGGTTSMFGVTFAAKRGRGVRHATPAMGRVAHSAHLVPRHARLRRLDTLVQAQRFFLRTQRESSENVAMWHCGMRAARTCTIAYWATSCAIAVRMLRFGRRPF